MKGGGGGSIYHMGGVARYNRWPVLTCWFPWQAYRRAWDSSGTTRDRRRKQRSSNWTGPSRPAPPNRSPSSSPTHRQLSPPKRPACSSLSRPSLRPLPLLPPPPSMQLLLLPPLRSSLRTWLRPGGSWAPYITKRLGSGEWHGNVLVTLYSILDTSW